MMKFLIITGMQNTGKTTTAGMVYKGLLPHASCVCLKDQDGKALSINSPLIENGKPLDFIPYMEVNGKRVAIVSLGDYPEYLKKQIEEYHNRVDYFVCCLRTQKRVGSTRKMVFTDYADYPKEEFWTIHSEDEKQKFAVKEKVVEQIIFKILKN